jgi:hypothetical protein
MAKKTRFDKLEPAKKKNWVVVTVVIIPSVVGGFAAFTNALEDILRVAGKIWSSEEEPWVSVTCRPETVPITIKPPLLGIQLHPKWKNYIQSGGPLADPEQAGVWPLDQPSGVGYQCTIFNGNPVGLFGLTLPLEVVFHSATAEVPGRSVVFVLPEPIDAQKASVLHIADDTSWSPEVIFPVRVKGRLGANTEATDLRGCAIPASKASRYGYAVSDLPDRFRTGATLPARTQILRLRESFAMHGRKDCSCPPNTLDRCGT